MGDMLLSTARKNLDEQYNEDDHTLVGYDPREAFLHHINEIVGAGEENTPLNREELALIGTALIAEELGAIYHALVRLRWTVEDVGLHG